MAMDTHGWHRRWAMHAALCVSANPMGLHSEGRRRSRDERLPGAVVHVLDASFRHDGLQAGVVGDGRIQIGCHRYKDGDAGMPPIRVTWAKGRFGEKGPRRCWQGRPWADRCIVWVEWRATGGPWARATASVQRDKGNRLLRPGFEGGRRALRTASAGS